MTKAEAPTGSGLPYALGAYAIWAFMPVYIKLLGSVAPLHIISHRILWSVPLCLIILAVVGQLGAFRAAISNRKVLLTIMLSSLLIASNWGIYVYAVADKHIVATSLGYYLNPLVNVLLAAVFLGERLNRQQWVAVAVASLGVSLLLIEALDTLWISLSLAFSFAFYGLVRKVAAVESLPGLSVEVCLLAPFALAFLLFEPSGTGFSYPADTMALLAAGGIVTAAPLLMFATAARRMSYTALGFVQYMSPSIVFLLGVFVYDEPLKPMQLLCFMFIWASILIFSHDVLKRHRASKTTI